MYFHWNYDLLGKNNLSKQNFESQKTFFHFQTKLPNDDVFEYCLEEQEEDNLVTITRSSSRPTTSSTSTSSAQSSTKKRKSTAWTD